MDRETQTQRRQGDPRARGEGNSNGGSSSVIVSTRALARRRHVGGDALLLPEVLLPVLGDAASRALEICDRCWPLAVRRRAQGVPWVREEVVRRRVCHDLVVCVGVPGLRFGMVAGTMDMGGIQMRARAG